MKMRVRSIGMLLAVVLACMSLMGARAQDATPDAVDMGASPVASPEAVAGCDTILGIGSTGDTCLILIQASEDAGDLDLYIDGLKAVESLTFTNVSGYFALPAGSHDFALVPAGETTDAALMTDDFATEAGTAYELAVVGTSDDLQLLVNPVDLSPLPPGTSGTPLENTRVRVIHAVPDAPAVNISVIAGDIAERVFTDLTYPQVTGYVEKTAGVYRVLIDIPDSNLPSIDLGETLFDGNTAYSIYAVGSIENSELDAVEVAVNLTTGVATARDIPPLLASEVVPVSNFAIYSGNCDLLSGEVAVALSGSGYEGAGPGTLAPWGGAGEPVGALGAVPVQYGEGTLDDMNLGDLLGGRAASVVIRDGATGGVVACGEIGGIVQRAGNFWQHDRLIIGLRPVGDSGIFGTATFIEDTGVLSDKIQVSVSVIGGTVVPVTTEATPIAS